VTAGADGRRPRPRAPTTGARGASTPTPAHGHAWHSRAPRRPTARHGRRSRAPRRRSRAPRRRPCPCPLCPTTGDTTTNDATTNDATKRRDETTTDDDARPRAPRRRPLTGTRGTHGHHDARRRRPTTTTGDDDERRDETTRRNDATKRRDDRRPTTDDDARPRAPRSRPNACSAERVFVGRTTYERLFARTRVRRVASTERVFERPTPPPPHPHTWTPDNSTYPDISIRYLEVGIIG